MVRLTQYWKGRPRVWKTGYSATVAMEYPDFQTLNRAFSFVWLVDSHYRMTDTELGMVVWTLSKSGQSMELCETAQLRFLAFARYGGIAISVFDPQEVKTASYAYVG